MAWDTWRAAIRRFFFGILGRRFPKCDHCGWWLMLNLTLPLSLLALLHPQCYLPLKVNLSLLHASLDVCILWRLLILVTLAHLPTVISRVALTQVCKIHIISVKAQLLSGHLISDCGLPRLAHVRLDSIISFILLLQLELVKLLHGLRPRQADPFLLESLEAVPDPLDVLLPLIQHL